MDPDWFYFLYWCRSGSGFYFVYKNILNIKINRSRSGSGSSYLDKNFGSGSGKMMLILRIRIRHTRLKRFKRSKFFCLYLNEYPWPTGPGLTVASPWLLSQGEYFAEGGRRAGGGRAAWRGVIGMLLGILRRWPIPLRKAENYTFSHCGERERGGKSWGLNGEGVGW